uniref:THAP-type domain-containing protein n=1 Tax=Graphocephala atropunctata TaxID=36148 RepID=A0A1B6L5Q8_9HEMI
MVMTCLYCGLVAKRSFHSFPLKHPDRLKQWLNHMGFPPDFKVTQTMKLCSQHFEDKYIYRVNTSSNLKGDSIPTIFNVYKSACIFCKATKYTHQDRSFHKFPVDNNHLLQKWLTAIGPTDIDITKSTLLCSNHFDEDSFQSSCGNARRLKHNAVPSIFICREVPVHQLDPPSRSLLKKKTVRSENSLPTPANPCELNTSHELSTFHHLRQDPLTQSVGTQTTLPIEITTPVTCSEQRTSEDSHHIRHDHDYGNSTLISKRKMDAMKNKLLLARKTSKIQKQHISRMKNKIALLKDVVKQLRGILQDRICADE